MDLHCGVAVSIASLMVVSLEMDRQSSYCNFSSVFQSDGRLMDHQGSDGPSLLPSVEANFGPLLVKSE
ncbi:hypothetical protein HAX54_014334, partial [Datura stramonium]|nr:hypothetical protein [Datura stramonium]